MEKSWVVYRHISPSGKVYVGITSNVKNRWANNGYHYHRYNTVFSAAIKKYGWDNFVHEILLENCSKEEANYTERYLIKWYKMHSQSYNITDGGEGCLGYVHTEESKKKASDHNKGKHPYNPKAIEASRTAMAKMSKEERKLKYGVKGMLGKHHSEETKMKMSEKAKGRDMSKAVAASQKVEHKWFSKPVIQIDLNNNIINEFSSIETAKNYLNKSSNSIANCLSGRANTAFGYRWKYKV